MTMQQLISNEQMETTAFIEEIDEIQLSGIIGGLDDLTPTLEETGQLTGSLANDLIGAVSGQGPAFADLYNALIGIFG